MPNKLKIKKITILTSVLFLLFFNIAIASFEITEIMYNPEGSDSKREWIEIKNNGNEPVDISKWYFFSDNTKHKLTSASSSTIDNGGYAVIVQDETSFKKDWPNYSGIIFDSSWSDFNNTSESFSLMDENQKIIDQVSYTSSEGAGDNSYSLQKINGMWQESKPTPGQENKLALNPKPVEKTDAKVSTLAKNVENKEFSGGSGNNFSSEKSDEIINLNDLDSGGRKVSISGEWKIKKYYPYLGLGLLILIGGASIILIRIKDKDQLEGNLNADDIKIVE